MTARTHDAFSFATLLTVAVLYPPASINLLTIAAAIIANNIGALLPDIDDASNRLYDLLPGDQGSGRELRKLFYGHRTITHSIIGVFLIYHIAQWLGVHLFNPAYIDATIVLYSFMIGYLSHLASDALTRDGLPLLFPLRWKFGFPPLSQFRIRTGTWMEFWVALPAVGAYVAWFIWSHQTQALHLLKSIVR